MTDGKAEYIVSKSRNVINVSMMELKMEKLTEGKMVGKINVTIK